MCLLMEGCGCKSRVQSENNMLKVRDRVCIFKVRDRVCILKVRDRVCLLMEGCDCKSE